MSKEVPVAFLFPGQGSQKVGMGLKLAEDHREAKLTFEEANDTLGRNISNICFNGPKEILDSTINTQPAILVTSIAALRVLKKMGKIPDQVAGHSLGEYSALVAAEALSFAQALRLVQERGRLMEEAGEVNPGSMAAVMGLDIEQVREICHQAGAEIANINTPLQIVISGKRDTVRYAADLVQNRKGKPIGLNVSIAAHSSLMEPAKKNMEILLRGIPIQNPKIPFVANVTGNYAKTGDEIRRYLVDQITGSVLWLDSIKILRSNGIQTFVDVGPGEIMAGMIRRIDPQVAVESFKE